ncbi:uncharacterized protein LOC121896819 isoform X4 [Thunnus maccoyii]|uniref:uncharacterized protein LOC121896819 isoform X4 n=1 Tax=Thunnus maccoyii TaxID=8240 RepID=UPI001C4D2FEF|nr:uncharacterized protein LOC121896819 isoform X4 [Thunnus maccoyii]
MKPSRVAQHQLEGKHEAETSDLSCCGGFLRLFIFTEVMKSLRSPDSGGEDRRSPTDRTLPVIHRPSSQQSGAFAAAARRRHYEPEGRGVSASCFTPGGELLKPSQPEVLLAVGGK